MTPFASAIIPSLPWNGTLGEALKSARDQSDPDVEPIIVADYDRRGPAWARNEGAKRATGEWLCFLDDDDLWTPDRIAKLRAADDGKVALVVHHAMRFSEDTNEELGTVGPVLGTPLVEQLRIRNTCCCSAVAVRRSVFPRFDESLRGVEDWHLWYRIARDYPTTVLPDVLTRKRERSESLMNGRSLSYYVGQYGRLIANSPELRDACSVTITGYHAGHSPGLLAGLLAMVRWGFRDEALMLLERTALTYLSRR
jgi:glycosyltransferase involved in cell wall biosynthesis